MNLDLRIAVAERVGYEPTGHDTWIKDGRCYSLAGTGWNIRLPEFEQDDDAMRHVIRLLPNEAVAGYQRHLLAIVTRDALGTSPILRMLEPTARQKAEAFVSCE